MINFHKLTLADREWMQEKYAEDAKQSCENSFTNNYVWREVYHVEVAEVEGCLVLRMKMQDKIFYSYPVGAGNQKAAIEQLLQECQELGQKLEMYPCNERDRINLLEWFPGQFMIHANRDNSDYIYSREKLTTLAGKKLHGKRNHIARFKDGDDWEYEEMNMENIPDCKKMTKEWIQMREEKWNEEMEQEMNVLYCAFDHFIELGLVGGVLKKAGEIVAFCVGEPLNDDTFVVHFEKAFPEMQGAYPMINQQFVEHACQNYTYINREEDTGDLGLRKAKLSYYPEILLNKYSVTTSDVVYGDKQKDRDAIQEIWQEAFGDEEEFIDYYIEKRMTNDNMLIIYQDGKAVSMASFLPAEYVTAQGELQPVRYVYAVATLQKYRGKGLATRIIEYAKTLWNEPLVLSPAEESLENYYETMGFQKAFLQDEMEDIQQNLPDLELNYSMEEIPASKYITIRNQHFHTPGTLLWNEQALQYAIDMNNYFAGKTLLITADTDTPDEQDQPCNQAILMYNIQSDTLHILETTLHPTCLQKLLPELLAQNHVEKYTLEINSGMIFTNNKEIISNTGYLGLTLG